MKCFLYVFLTLLKYACSIQPPPLSMLEASLLVKIVEKKLEEIQLLLRWRKSLILCLKSFHIYFFSILIKEVT